MKRIFALCIILILLLTAFVYAEQEQDSEVEDIEETDDSDDGEVEDDDETSDIEDEIEIDDEDDLTDDEAEEIEAVESELEVETEKDENGKNKVHAKLSNGNNVLVKIMPITASEKAIEALELHNCVEEEGCTIELKEVGDGKLAYEVETEKDAKLFGFLKTKMKVNAQIDAENGEIIKMNKPWWALFVSMSEEEVVEETTT